MEPGARFNYRPGRLDACPVPRHARKVTPARPAPIAVHDDGDVLREAIRIKLTEQPLLIATGWFERVRYFHALIPANSKKRIEASLPTFLKS
jgi:hypothetical protein